VLINLLIAMLASTYAKAQTKLASKHQRLIYIRGMVQVLNLLALLVQKDKY